MQDWMSFLRTSIY